MNDSLLPIDQFIEAARKQGAAFGDGDAKIHLAYLTKIGILPQSTKRKINGDMTGCYQESLIRTLLKVEQMKNKGMTFSQIAKTINLQSSLVLTQSNSEMALDGTNSLIIETHNLKTQGYQLIKNPSFLYLIIGVLFGFLLSTLNSQGLAQMQKQAGLTPTNEMQSASINSAPQTVGSVYVLSVPKQNLDKLEKTNINYLINN